MARWNSGCSCALCRQMQSDAARARGRRTAQERLPPEVRQRVLDAICAGQSFRRVLGDLGLTPNQVWGLTKSDQEWSGKLDAALTATRRDDLRHGTNAAYVHGCVCSECREHQRIRMATSPLMSGAVVPELVRDSWPGEHDRLKMSQSMPAHSPTSTVIN